MLSLKKTQNIYNMIPEESTRRKHIKTITIPTSGWKDNLRSNSNFVLCTNSIFKIYSKPVENAPGMYRARAEQTCGTPLTIQYAVSEP